MDPHVSLVTLGVSDMAHAIAFYRDGLGLSMREREGDGPAFFPLEGTWIALYPRDALAEDATVSSEGDGFAGVTIAHNVENREAVDTVLREAADAGARIVKQAREADWGGYSGYFADPDDHLWEVAWNPVLDID
ncbi:VOC family protein [Natrialba taiwanensis]|uniref:Glyoxalase/bleomycin resistance protein/dioxygenase n=1 Tax=Natrialba taiwanensis DSM 12281 TaxID=1230458 RepID=L9ZSM8_9EURY|nr:VOC family protein [Natrialba taiwanensis]ELY89384.1 glyoxalase/bleomycin resistance protein/dioxygenase [Natrialba taiwanensis DSM 12281]